MAIDVANGRVDRDMETAIIERITDRRAVRTWVETLLGSVEATVGDEMLQRATDVFVELSTDKASGWHFYLARIDGRPVGTSALHLGAAAGLYSVGTLPLVRRQGVGTALSKRALVDARSAGYRVATLTASELGADSMSRLGSRSTADIESMSGGRQWSRSDESFTRWRGCRWELHTQPRQRLRPLGHRSSLASCQGECTYPRAAETRRVPGSSLPRRPGSI